MICKNIISLTSSNFTLACHPESSGDFSMSSSLQVSGGYSRPAVADNRRHRIIFDFVLTRTLKAKRRLNSWPGIVR